MQMAKKIIRSTYSYFFLLLSNCRTMVVLEIEIIRVFFQAVYILHCVECLVAMYIK